jgi:GDPmannose 4,6-dehydratase
VSSDSRARRRALVTGITGQDGSFLAELLLAQGYAVSGLVRPSSLDHLGCSEHLRERLDLLEGDLLEPESLEAAVRATLPDELYHLAAPSFVPASWERPRETLAAIAGSAAALMESVRAHSSHTRLFIAASGAIFGAAPESPQHEGTPCRPQHPYATAKLAAHELVGQLRERDGIFVCSGILYNHESERRPPAFVSRKVTRGAAEVKLGARDLVELGDLEVVRDWSFAGDVMHGAWLMLQQERAEDFILSSGTPHTVMELAQAAFAHVGLDAREHIRVDRSLQRAPEHTPMVGDPGRARERLGWQQTMSFEQLIARMVDADLKALSGA